MVISLTLTNTTQMPMSMRAADSLVTCDVTRCVAASIKMGDYYWFGCSGDRDVARAAGYYADAALRHDPHVSRAPLSSDRHTFCLDIKA